MGTQQTAACMTEETGTWLENQVDIISCWEAGSISLPVLAISLLTIFKRGLTHAMPCKSINIS